MKARKTHRLLSLMLTAAITLAGLPVTSLTQTLAAEQSADRNTGLQQLGIIDAPGEEDTRSDLTDRAKHPRLTYNADGQMVIAIDAGHGGTDRGASYGGLMEKDLNLKIATYLKSYLNEYEGVQVYMTRSDDTYVGLTDRVSNAAANGADVFISIHNNASDNAKLSGSMVFYPNTSYIPALNEEGSGLSASILGQLTGLGLPDLGIRTRDSETGNKYDDGSLADYYSVIRNAKLQGITGIIVEHAFVSCKADRENYLSTDEQLKALALADAKGIADYYHLDELSWDVPGITLSAPNEKKLRVSWNPVEDIRGYIVYRSKKRDSGYKRIAKLPGEYNDSYTDTDITLGETYYYKVRTYTGSTGNVRYSPYSNIVHGQTIGRTKITSLKQMSGGYFKISWEPMPKADGYVIYRSEEGGGYVSVGVVNDPKKGAFNDRTVTEGVNYSYKVRPRNDLYGNVGYGKCTPVVTAKMIRTPEITRIDVRDDATLKVVWKKALGTSRYVVRRSTSEDGTYETVATITDDTKNYYVDKNTEYGMTYYYQVNAYNQYGIVHGSTGFVEPVGVYDFQTPELRTTRMAKSKAGVYLLWTEVPGAAGYRIYRSTRENSGYTKVVTLQKKDALNYIDCSSTEAGRIYYYKVKAFTRNSQGTAWSECSNVKSVEAGTSIMGKSSTSVKKMAKFYAARGGEYPAEMYEQYGAPTIEDFCQIVYEEAEAEGVRAEVVFAQICKETGFLRFGGDVLPEQCNFAGIGAVGGGAQGYYFPDVTTGIRAQVQHLKAYASDKPLNNECVDPRFSFVKRTSAIYVEWLGIQENPTGAGWATGENYGYSLRDDYLRPLLEY